MVWTINDVKTFKYLIDLGVDGIITDKPSFFLRPLILVRKISLVL